MKPAVLSFLLFVLLLLSACSSPHRLAGVWMLDKALERKTLDENAPMGSAAKVPGNLALADNVTISFTSRKITWVIEAGGVRYDEYDYTIKSADAHSVTVVEKLPATGATQEVVYHFETDNGEEVMWTSDPEVNRAMGMELRIYFQHSR